MGEIKLGWETPKEHEKPFWRDGMTPEEYDRENEYLGRNFHRLREGTYIPLWKQDLIKAQSED